MPWVRALLRNQTVLAKAKADGSFLSDGSGRVEIRYRASDPKAYRAAERNLERVAGAELMPDDAVVAAVEAPPVEQKPVAVTKLPPDPKLNAAGKEARSLARKDQAAAAALKEDAVPKDAWIVYVDGACSGNPGPAGLGIVIIAPDRSLKYDGYEYLGEATNNVAELTGILRATERVPSGATAYVHTDSQYSIGVLNKGWKAKANQELIAKVRAGLSSRKTWKLIYVPGHHGVEYNERADELAREAISQRDTKLPIVPAAT